MITLKDSQHPNSRSFNIAKELDQWMAELPQARRVAIEARAGELAALKDSCQATVQTQQDLAALSSIERAG